MVLAIVLVVDDAIVVLENLPTHRMGEPTILAAYRGAKVGFAVINNAGAYLCVCTVGFLEATLEDYLRSSHWP